jgi:hypothetical protein
MRTMGEITQRLPVKGANGSIDLIEVARYEGYVHDILIFELGFIYECSCHANRV